MIGGNALSKAPVDECRDAIIATVVDGTSNGARSLQPQRQLLCGITPM
jgi:hypothetical protein